MSGELGHHNRAPGAVKVVVGRRTSRMEVDSGHWMVKIVEPVVRMVQERGCDRDGVEKCQKWIKMTGRW